MHYSTAIGEVWKPFLFARLDGEATELNETGSITYASAIVWNAEIADD